MELNGSINDEADLAESSRSLLADTRAVQLEMNPPHGHGNNNNNNANSRDFSGASGFGSASNSPQLSGGKRLGGL